MEQQTNQTILKMSGEEYTTKQIEQETIAYLLKRADADLSICLKGLRILGERIR